MNSTFKCWLIANFEIFIILLTVLLSFIIYGFILVFGKVDDTTGESVVFSFFWIILLCVLIPTKKASFQYAKYFTMFLFIFFAYSKATNPDPDTPIETIEMCANIVKWFWKLYGIATILSIWLAIYTYRNFDEVVSRRMLYHNSNVSLYEYKWKYTMDRFCNITVSIVISLFTLTSVFR